MSYQAIIEYLEALEKIYSHSKRDKKTQLIDDACKITGRHRKTIIRNLNTSKDNKSNLKKNCGAKIQYPEELLLPHIRFLWMQMERITAKRMKVALDDWLPKYHINDVTPHVKALLSKMSASTLERFLRKIRKLEQRKQKGLSSTVPARYMKNKVPINTLDSLVVSPGTMQTDTVAHCGERLEGAFMNSLTLTDIHSTWTVNRAIFQKKGKEVKSALDFMERSLPFDLKAINSDSGSEFLNMPVFNMYKKKKIKFTRSRPYKKNDNCYVEQKNFTHVRELFGYERIDSSELTTLMNEIYADYWNPLQNYFLPTFKLKEKVRIGGRIKKVYDEPKTPYQRLLDSELLNDEQVKNLKEEKRKLNPFELKKGLEEKLANFFYLLKENKMEERKAA